MTLRKWESLSEENWKEFDDENAVYDFIAKAISESISKRKGSVNTSLTETDILMQV